MVSIPRLESCCCGCTLRTGTLILVYLSLIGALLSPFSPPQNTSKDSDSKPAEQPMYVKISGAVVGIIACVCALYGVYAERHGFLLPYLILETLSIIYLIIFGILIVIINVLVGIVYFLLTIPAFYFWLVIYNHYREIQEGKGSSSAA